MKNYLVALALAAGSLAVQAADGPAIYRCGSSYQQTPCADGKAIETDDARTPAEVAVAKDVASQSRRQAEAMVRDRERHEASVTPARATAIGPRQSAEHAVRPLKAAKRKPRTAIKAGPNGELVAVVPRKRKTPKAA